MTNKLKEGVSSVKNPDTAPPAPSEAEKIEAEFSDYMKKGDAISTLNFTLLLVSVIVGTVAYVELLVHIQVLAHGGLSIRAAHKLLRMGLL